VRSPYRQWPPGIHVLLDDHFAQLLHWYLMLTLQSLKAVIEHVRADSRVHVAVHAVAEVISRGEM